MGPFFDSFLISAYPPVLLRPHNHKSNLSTNPFSAMDSFSVPSSPLPYGDYDSQGNKTEDDTDTDSDDSSMEVDNGEEEPNAIFAEEDRQTGIEESDEEGDAEDLNTGDGYTYDDDNVDEEANEYERENPMNEDDVAFTTKHQDDDTPADDPSLHLQVNNSRADGEINNMQRYVARLQEQHGDELIPDTSSEEDETPRPTLKRLKLPSSHDSGPDSPVSGVFEEALERARQARKKKAAQTGNIADFFVASKPADSKKRSSPDFSSSDDDEDEDEDEAMNSEEVADSRHRKKMRTLSSESSSSELPIVETAEDPDNSPDPDPGRSVSPVNLLKKNSETQHGACAFTGVQHLYFPKNKSPNSLHALSPISNPPEFFSYLFPIDFFHWHESRVKFKMFQATYCMAYVATSLHYQNCPITVHFWPVSFGEVKKETAMTNFFDSCARDDEVVYFVNIICYGREALEMFSKNLSYDPTGVENRGGSKAGRKTRLQSLYDISRDNPRKTAIGNIKYLCERRLPRKEWNNISQSLFRKPNEFAASLVLLAKTIGTVQQDTTELNIVEGRHNLLSFSKMGTDDDGAECIIEAPHAKTMFGFEEVLTAKFSTCASEFVDDAIIGLNSANIETDGTIENRLWPDDTPAYFLSFTSVQNFPLMVDVIHSPTFPLSLRLVKDSLVQTDGDEITVPPVSGLESLEEILANIIDDIRQNGTDDGECFDALLSISRLILTQNCQFHNPWQREILNFAKRVVSSGISTDVLKSSLSPDYNEEKMKFNYFGNESMMDLFNHCQHGMQMGNLHTPMAKLYTISLTALLRNPPQEQVPGALLNGIFSGGKSYMLQQIEDMFPEGAAEKSVGGSNQAEMENTYQMIKIQNELDPRLLSKNKHMQGLSIAKTNATEKGKQKYKRMQSKDGGPFVVETVEYNSRHTTFQAMNTDVNDLDPAMRSRCISMTVGDENKPDNKDKRETNGLSISATTKGSQKIKNSFTSTFQFRFWLFHVIDTVSGYCLRKTPRSDLYSFMFQKIAKINSSLNISNPRTAGFVQNFARTHTLMEAVYITMNNLECFTASEIAEMQACLHPDDTTSKQAELVLQLKKMSSKSLMKRVLTRPWALLMTHFSNFDDAASILYGMSIPFDTTSANAAKMILIVLKDLCYGGTTNQEASEYITIRYNTQTLVTAICTRLPKFNMKEKDEDHVRMALMSLAGRIITSNEGASVDAQAIIFRDKTVDVHKGLLSTTTTPMEKRAVKSLNANKFFEVILKSNSNSLQEGNQIWGAFVETGAHKLYKINVTSSRFTQFEHAHREISTFVDKLSVLHTQKFCCRVEGVANQEQYYLISPDMMDMFLMMNTSTGSKQDETAEFHTGFSKVAKLVGCFTGEAVNDNYVVVEPEFRNSIKYGMVSSDKAADYDPEDSDYIIRNPRFVPKEDLRALPAHCQDIIDEEPDTGNEFITFERDMNNEDLQERVAYQTSEIYKILGLGHGDSEKLRDIVYSRISRAGAQKHYRNMSKKGQMMPQRAAKMKVDKYSHLMQIAQVTIDVLQEEHNPGGGSGTDNSAKITEEEAKLERLQNLHEEAQRKLESLSN